MTVFLILLLVLLCIISFVSGIVYRKKIGEKAIESAEKEAERIVRGAKESIEARRKEAALEGKEEVHKFRVSVEREISDMRRDIQHHERRIQQKEENVDKRVESLEKKENMLKGKEKEIADKMKEIERIKKSQFEMLEKISGFTIKQAKEYLLRGLDEELAHEKAVKIMEYEQKIKEESDLKARDILSIAMQRCAAYHVSETVVSVVPLPNDDMKGRIIGREGRNIRSIENLTGVDLIIDDTPETITLSGFDPIRREIARVALESLIADGRIHPSKIEEMVEKAKADVEKDIKEEGQNAALEVKINNLHPEIVKILGRLKYRTSYGQNVLRHSIEVAHLCGMIASELGLDPSVAKRAGLLHDIGKALDHEIEGSHVDIGLDIMKKYKENESVMHAVHAHHGDVEPKTVEAFILQAADALSAARPGARRENIENYIRRLKKLEELVSSFTGVSACFAIQAGREVRVMVKPEVIDDEKMIPLARSMCKKIESELEYPGQVKVNIIRESKVIEYAR